MVIDRGNLINEPLWKKEPVITSGYSIKFVVEVVSNNAQNEYARKLDDYAKLGIPEYWIVDCAAMEGERFIGKSNNPTLTICTLINDIYEEQALKHHDQISSLMFPDLNLTFEQILNFINPITTS